MTTGSCPETLLALEAVQTHSFDLVTKRSKGQRGRLDNSNTAERSASYIS